MPICDCAVTMIVTQVWSGTKDICYEENDMALGYA